MDDDVSFSVLVVVTHYLSLYWSQSSQHTSMWRKNKLKGNKKDSLYKPVAVICMQIFKTAFKSLNNNTPKKYHIQTTNTLLILSLKYSWTFQGFLGINFSKKIRHTYLFTEITAAKMMHYEKKNGKPVLISDKTGI